MYDVLFGGKTPYKTMISPFTVEIAGIPAEIRCTFPENKRFFEGYFTDKEPLITVEPTHDDWEQMQKEIDVVADMNGTPRQRRSDSSLENTAIHALMAEKLTAYNGLLMHGSALCMDGQAVVFLAHSGTGKSTHSRIWRETFGDRVWMINDDKPIFRVIDGKAFVYGTPWSGQYRLSRNASAPLKAMVLLARSEKNKIVPITKIEAFPMLMPYAYFSKKPDTMKQILEVESKLVDAAEFYVLGCNMSPEAAEVAYEGIFKPV